jgi:hypothetical protein
MKLTIFTAIMALAFGTLSLAAPAPEAATAVAAVVNAAEYAPPARRTLAPIPEDDVSIYLSYGLCLSIDML